MYTRQQRHRLCQILHGQCATRRMLVFRAPTVLCTAHFGDLDAVLSRSTSSANACASTYMPRSAYRVPAYPRVLTGVQLIVQATQSVVVVDSFCAVCATQTKVLLAVIARSFGDCYPWVMVCSIQLAMVLLIVVTHQRTYSSVLSMNAVRKAGLLAASLNGIYATYVVFIYPSSQCLEYDSQGSLAQLVENDHVPVMKYSVLLGLALMNSTVLAFGKNRFQWHLSISLAD